MSTFAFEGDASAQASAKQEIVPSDSVATVLASLIPRSYRPSTLYGWNVGLASVIFKKGN
uniref:Uncharacterized protein MANES_14G133000 n=1 Tax=Rhizophora mucronata TaxID=61149 RepID=A0A2P2JD61_RHIMU